MRSYCAFLVAIVALLTQPTRGAKKVLWAPPDLHAPLALPRATVPKPMVTRIQVEGFPIFLEQTKLEAAERHFQAQAGHQGDASGSISWLCFYGKDDTGLWGLWLTRGEIDGPDIGGFQWQRLSAGETLDPRCKLLGGREPIQISLPVRLGMPARDVERVMGHPSMRYQGTAIYYHHHDLTIERRPYSADNTVYVTFREGILQSLAAEYLISS